MSRTIYHMFIELNGLQINEVIIDQHYSSKHSDINDALILELLKELNGIYKEPAKIDGYFKYYVEEPIFLKKKPYRLIFLMEDGQSYIGVINAFRVKEKKWDFLLKNN